MGYRGSSNYDERDKLFKQSMDGKPVNNLEVKKNLEIIRTIPNSASIFDKLAGDMFVRQGQYVEAIRNYRRAMSHTEIDTGVYIGYARALMGVKRLEDNILKAAEHIKKLRDTDPTRYDDITYVEAL